MEEWACEFVANAIKDRVVYHGESLGSVAYNWFDHNFDRVEGEAPGILHLTPPSDKTPEIYFENWEGGLDESPELVLVFAWEGEVKQRIEFGL